MADRSATVRLDLKGDGFRRGLKSAERDAGRSGQTMGSRMGSGLNAGAKAGLDSYRRMFSTIKTGAMALSGILGGIGTGQLVQQAIDADKQFRSLAFSMGAGTGKFRDFAKVQSQAQEVAKRWGQDSAKLGSALGTVFDTVGDSDFALATMDQIAMTSRATGEELGTIAPIVAEMNRQFGITSDEVGTALPRVISLGSRGGLSVADLGATLGKLGRTAKVAGLEGEEGLATLLAMANQISAASGNAEGSVEKLQIVFTKLASGQGAAFLQTLKNSKGAQLFGADVEGLGTLERLSLVLDKAKSNPRILSQVFGEQGVFIEQAFGNLGDVGKAMREASEGAIDSADLQDAAKANMQTASAGIDQALETLKQAFTKPEMMSAIERLAEALPGLAEGMSKLAGFVADSPFTAIGGAMSAKALASGILGAMTTGGTTAAGAMGTSITTAGNAAGASMAGQIAGAAATAAAGFAIALAADQALKLDREEAERRKSIGDERENLLAAEEARGGTSAVRQKNGLAEAIAQKGVLGLTADDLFGSNDTEILTRGENGEVVARAPGRSRGEDPVSVPFTPNAINMESDADFEARLAGIRQRFAAEEAASAAAAGRATAAEIAGRTLNVRVTNTVQTSTRGKGGTTGTPPPPGYFPR
jgi:hypothetical protein